MARNIARVKLKNDNFTVKLSFLINSGNSVIHSYLYNKASLLTASGMLLHALLPMFHVFVSSRRELPENCVYKQGGLNCFIEYSVFAQKIINCQFSLL